jgi:thiamine biosynthesis lipoprotein
MTSSSLVLLLVFLQTSNLQLYEAVEPHMGTMFRIKLYAKDRAQAQEAFRAAFNRISQLDETLSDDRPDSELSRLSQIAVHHPVRVSDDLYRVLESAQNLSIESSGAFDITLGPLTHLWRLARKRNRLPQEAEIEQAKAQCGFGKLHLDTTNHTIQLEEAGMQLDVGGIAKGFAADEALTVLQSRGIQSSLVAASGDLAFSDPPPGEQGWKIGIDSLDDAHAPFTRVMVLSNAAVSTSGASEQHLDVAGTRYSHIIDPATGLGITKEITATVICRHGIDADSMATVVTVLGVSRGLALIDHHPGAMAIVVSKEGDQLKLFESKEVIHKS